MCFPRLPGFSHPLLEVESEAWLDIWLITCLTSAKSGGCSSVELVESCTLVGSLKLQPCNSARILSTRGTTSSVLHCFFFFVLNLMYSYFGVGYVRVLRTRDKAERARLKFAIDRCSCCSSFLDIFRFPCFALQPDRWFGHQLATRVLSSYDSRPSSPRWRR